MFPFNLIETCGNARNTGFRTATRAYLDKSTGLKKGQLVFLFNLRAIRYEPGMVKDRLTRILKNRVLIGR